jgi:Flp pilus assembly protein CpaB
MPAVELVPRRPLLARISLGHVVMVVTGLLAFLLVLAILRGDNETVPVATASRDIPAGSTLSRDAVVFVDASVADADLVGALVTDVELDEALSAGSIARSTIRAGDPIRSGDIGSPTSADGSRAMAIELTPGHSVGGDVRVGDRVDVVVVRGGVSSYVTTGSEVIAVTSSGGTVAASGRIVITIAADASATLRLASAISDGDVYVIRSTGSPAADPTETFDPGAGDA